MKEVGCSPKALSLKHTMAFGTWRNINFHLRKLLLTKFCYKMWWFNLPQLIIDVSNLLRDLALNIRQSVAVLWQFLAWSAVYITTKWTSGQTCGHTSNTPVEGDGKPGHKQMPNSALSINTCNNTSDKSSFSANTILCGINAPCALINTLVGSGGPEEQYISFSANFYSFLTNIYLFWGEYSIRKTWMCVYLSRGVYSALYGSAA